MRLKLDLHPIFNDTRGIENALKGIIEEAVEKRAKEVEIIPGKGSGALKKTVIRFLQRPDIKAKYHRLEKDSDNWGRLFVHFRPDRSDSASSSQREAEGPLLSAPCACCGEELTTPAPEDSETGSVMVLCPACDSPNRVTYRQRRQGLFQTRAELDYSDSS